MTQITINSDSSLQDAFGKLRDMYRAHKYLRVHAKTGKDRSIDQNSISHAWYEQLARELKEDNALGHKCFCKLHYGVPILRSEDQEFRDAYDAKVLHSFSYDQKLTIMEWFPVTSLMNKDQLSRYLLAMQAGYARAGVLLEFPEVKE